MNKSILTYNKCDESMQNRALKSKGQGQATLAAYNKWNEGGMLLRGIKRPLEAAIKANKGNGNSRSSDLIRCFSALASLWVMYMYRSNP